jgi:hypothetical protein
MTTKAESNEQMNEIIRRAPQRSPFRMEFENGRGRVVATEPPAAKDGATNDDTQSKGADNDD